MDELERVNKRLKTGRDDLLSRLDEKLQQLNDEEKKLLDRQSEFEEKKRTCAAASGNLDVSDDDIIEINAGGKNINAKRGTLCQRKGTRLEALFSGRWDKTLLRDKDGRIFLDVNGDCFQAIIDWLNVLAISSEDERPEYPTVDEEYKYLLQHQMSLFIDNSLATVDSNIIINSDYLNNLRNWLEGDGSGGALKLLYRSSRDGISGENFHDKVDNVGRTLVVIETTEGGVVGGYSNTAWDLSTGGCTVANKAFLFALSGFGLLFPCKMKLKVKNYEGAITNKASGPVFGGGRYSFNQEYDLRTNAQELILNVGNAYERPSELLTPPPYEIKEMEAFQVDDVAIYQDVRKPKQTRHSTVNMTEVSIDTFSSEMSGAINEKLETLKEMEAKLLSLEESFDDEEHFINCFVNGDTSDIISLNVSGTMMTTKRATLQVVDNSVLAQQFDDTKWTEQGCKNEQVKEWTPDEVAHWVKSIEGIPEDIATSFTENEINGLELLALDRDGLKDIGVKRVGTICLLLKEIKQLEKKVSQGAVTLIEHSPYCFGKILDFLRIKHLSSLELTGGPAPPFVCDHKRDMFVKVVRYYFPGDSSEMILRP